MSSIWVILFMIDSLMTLTVFVNNLVWFDIGSNIDLTICDDLTAERMVTDTIELTWQLQPLKWVVTWLVTDDEQIDMMMMLIAIWLTVWCIHGYGLPDRMMTNNWCDEQLWWCDRDLLCMMTWQWAAVMMMLKQHKNRLECWVVDQQYWPAVEQRQVIDEMMWQ